MTDPDLTRGRELLAAVQSFTVPGWVWTNQAGAASAKWNSWLRDNGPALLTQVEADYKMAREANATAIDAMNERDAALTENARLTKELAEAMSHYRDSQ